MRTLFRLALLLLLAAPTTATSKRNPHRLQMTLQANAFTPEFIDVLTRRVRTFAAYRGLGDARVYQPEPGKANVLVELPIKRSEVRNHDVLDAALEELLTRPGGIQFLWHVGASALPVVQALKAQLKDAWVDEHRYPHLRVPATTTVEALEEVLSKVKTPKGSRWLVQPLAKRSRETGTSHVVHLASDSAFLTDTQISSVEIVPTEFRHEALMIRFTPQGASVLADATKVHVKECLLVVFEGRVLYAPMVMEPIAGGRAVLDLGLTGSKRSQRPTLEKLASAMNGAALNVRVKVSAVEVLEPLPDEPEPPK